MNTADEIPLLQHMTWLDRVSTGPTAFISESVANLSRAVLLNAIAASGGELPIPAAGCGEDGNLLMTWDRGELHLEAEVADDASEVVWFFRDRSDESIWLEEVPSGAVPARAFPVLKLLATLPPDPVPPKPTESLRVRCYRLVGSILYRLIGIGWA